MRAKIKLCFLLIMVLPFCLLLGGCRSSPVLEQIIYKQEAEMSNSDEMLDPGDTGQEDEQLDNKPEEEADTERDTDEDQGLEGDDDDAQDAAESDHNNQSQDDFDTPSAPTQSTPPESSPDPQSGEQPGGDPTDENEGGNPDGEGDENGDGETPDNTGGDTATGKQIVDASGRTVNVPQNVGTVTATGAAAQIVELIGGENRLAATDSGILSSELAMQAFPDLSSVPSWWSDNANNPISAKNFEALIAAHPDVCFELSGDNTFSNSQVEQLAAADISYVVLPGLSSADNLKQTVSLIAEVLGGEAVEKAEAYSAWVDSVVSEVSNKTAGTDLTSLYIADWDSGASYQLSDTAGVIEPYGSGLAMAYSPLKSQLVSSFMSVAHVTNESTRIRSMHLDSKYVYVAPMFHQFSAAVSGSRAAFYSGAGEYGSAYDLFVTRLVGDTTYTQLGSSQFPAVIAANDTVRESIENDYFWKYRPSDANGYVNIDGESFYRGVCGEYAIYVNPSGMCDWADGGLESPLEAYWIAYKFCGAYSLNEVKDKTAEFYNKFFGVSLSDGQLKNIFGE
jgi:ABC-type Fe3+-hydroxamate transport system substrate-binding protein